MATTTLNDLAIGATLTFRSKRADDTVVWKGVLIGRGSYPMIRGYMNPAAYNEAVRQSDPTVPQDVTTLGFFLIQIDNASTVPTVQVFAEEWISPGSLTEIVLGKTVTLQISDPRNNTQAIVELLGSAGYYSKIIQG